MICAPSFVDELGLAVFSVNRHLPMVGDCRIRVFSVIRNSGVRPHFSILPLDGIYRQLVNTGTKYFRMFGINRRISVQCIFSVNLSSIFIGIYR